MTPNPLTAGRILVIDDELGIRDSLRMILEYEGYACALAATGEEGLALARSESPDLVFCDIKMPGVDGLEVLGRLKAQDESLPVVMISGHGTVATAVEATKLGAQDFIEKPLSSERVLLTIRNSLKTSRLERENRRLRGAEDARYNIVGQGPALMQVLDAIGRAAPTNATVLVLGESGVGKELVARAIHRNSLRSRERYVQVNCAAIPEELIESELFGHEKGSFTGATDKQIGKFELADRGTIFLDEVGDMSQKTQAEVLRVLQEGEVERIGSQRTLKVDVRVIAATNKDLEAAIAEGTFREDLYFRLSVIPVRVPALRERREDVPLLVKHFADLFAGEGGRTRRFSVDAMELLQLHRWRGNIRELKNTVERALIMAPGDTIVANDLRPFLRAEGAPLPLPVAAAVAAGSSLGAAVPSGSPTSSAVTPYGSDAASDSTESGAADLTVATEPSRPLLPTPTTLREFKEQAEREFLVDKLREHGWNISRTAEVIDTPRSNLYKKLEQYAISQEKDR
ncbi:MAG: sigma-54-dependent transcriptional regulator [Luteitalea sp.]